jgi:S-adenosylmethionine/arginine decarboxylase-like enzyme
MKIEEIKLNDANPRYITDAKFKQLVASVADFPWQPQGYTCLYLLAESHFAIHTWPEEQTTYVELSSCNRDFFHAFTVLLRARFS